MNTCPQCGGDNCGPVRCRFSMMEHSAWREEQKANAYAEAAIRRDKERHHSGDQDNFGVSACGRSHRAGK